MKKFEWIIVEVADTLLMSSLLCLIGVITMLVMGVGFTWQTIGLVLVSIGMIWIGLHYMDKTDKE